MPAPALRRHRLAFLTPAGWAALVMRDWDAEAWACLAHWQRHDLPLIVTVQRAVGPDDVALGLPAPLQWDRRRLALQVPHAALARFTECPALSEVLRDRADLPSAWHDVAAILDRLRAPAHVYGSHGWQQLTGLAYVHAESDLDLWVGVHDEAHADAVAQALAGLAGGAPRCDGELVFANGAAVNWREWAAWRAGQARGLLVRDTTGARLLHDGSPAHPARSLQQGTT